MGSRLRKMKKADYELLLMQLGDGTAHLRPEHFLSALYTRQNDFAKTLDSTLLSIKYPTSSGRDQPVRPDEIHP